MQQKRKLNVFSFPNNPFITLFYFDESCIIYMRVVYSTTLSQELRLYSVECKVDR
jgi:hypothetical protein